MMRKAFRDPKDPAWPGKSGDKKPNQRPEPEAIPSRDSDPAQALNMSNYSGGNISCDCGRTFSKPVGLANHKRACKLSGNEYTASPGGKITCICGKTYPTRQRWLDHFNRFCKKEPQASPKEISCRFCDSTWPSVMSARQHERQKHPQDYNDSLVERASQPSRSKRWTDDEKRTMALLEKSYTGSDLKGYLSAKLGRSVTAIECMRARQPYKNLLADMTPIRSTFSNSPESSVGAPLPTSPTPKIPNTSVRGSPTTSSPPSSSSPTNSPSSSSEQYLTPEKEEVTIHDIEIYTTPPAISSVISSPASPSLPASTVSSPSLMYVSPTVIDATNGNIITTPRRSRIQLPRRALRCKNLPLDLDKITLISSESIDQPEMSQEPPLSTESPFLDAIKVAEQKTKIKALQGTSSFLRTADKIEIEAFLDNMVDTICPPRVKGVAKISQNNESTQIPLKKKRAGLFKRYQDLFRKNKKSLMQEIINGQTEDDVYPSKPDIRRHFDALYASKPVKESFQSAPKTRKNDTFYPISSEEIEEAIKGKNTAPGPDCISKTDMRKKDVHAWVILYNAMLWSAVTPKRLRESRTSLLHKKNDRKDPKNWRPITISSIIVRTLHKILAERMYNAVDLADGQRGFCNIDGTMINSTQLEIFLRESRQSLSTHCVASIDVQAAFDSVDHKSIGNALSRMGIEDQMIRYIMEHYRGLTTSIYCGKQDFGQFSISSGVKQGDPLSPILFNCVLDKFISSLPNDIGGTVAGKKISVLAFADDLLFLSNSPAAMQMMLDLLGKFLESEGMRANVNKCHALFCEKITGVQKLAVITKSTFQLQGQPIPSVGVIDSFRYLGRDIGFMGHQKPNSIKTLSENLLSLQKAPLKPFQKMELLRTYLIPRFIYGFQNFKIEKQILTNADRLVRRFVRRTLHLHASVENILIHAPEKDGGLGIFSFTESIPRILMSRLNKMLAMPAFQYLLTSNILQNILAKISKLVIPPSSTKNSTFGEGLHQCSEDSASNAWIRHPPPFWTGYQYNAAHQLRTNSLPTRNQPGKPEHLRKCRAGCDKFETVCHILQACPLTHFPRIRRHNHVMKMIQKIAIEQGFSTEMEPRIRDATKELFIPDMIMKKGKTAIVVDANVPWETEDLKLAAQNKKSKYGKPPLEAAIKSKYGVTEVLHMPVIVGARGIWSKRANKEIEDTLHLTGQMKRKIITDVIQWGVSIYRQFGRVNWHTVQRP